MSGFQLPGDMWRPLREHIQKLAGDPLQLLIDATQPLVDVSTIDDEQLAERMFELAESDLLDPVYCAACFEAGMRLLAKGKVEGNYG